MFKSSGISNNLLTMKSKDHVPQTDHQAILPSDDPV